jgi:hypothetical protein
MWYDAMGRRLVMNVRRIIGRARAAADDRSLGLGSLLGSGAGLLWSVPILLDIYAHYGRYGNSTRVEDTLESWLPCALLFMLCGATFGAIVSYLFRFMRS